MPKKRGAIGYDNAISLIKIIALLKIVTLHFASWSNVYVPLFFFNGSSLRLFVIASGFGITKLYLEKKHNGFWIIWHQLKKIYLCIAIALPVILVGILIKFRAVDIFSYISDMIKVILGLHVEEPRLLLNYLGLNITEYPQTNGALWFISLIIWLYLLFPLIYWLFKKIKPEIILLALLQTSYSFSSYFDPAYKSIAYNLFFFAFGMYFALNYCTIKDILKKKHIITPIFLLTAIIFNLSYQYSFFHFIFELFMFLSLYILFNLTFFTTMKWVREYDKAIFFVYLIHQPFTGVFSFLLWKTTYSHLQNAIFYMIYLILVMFISSALLNTFKKIYKFEKWSDLLKQSS